MVIRPLGRGWIAVPITFFARAGPQPRVFFSAKQPAAATSQAAILLFPPSRCRPLRQGKLRAPVLPAVRLNTVACGLCREPAWFGRRSLSASRGFGFRGVPRGDQAARRARNLDKCFS
jgi:hypothetical protein